MENGAPAEKSKGSAKEVESGDGSVREEEDVLSQGQSRALQESNKQKENSFKALHGWLIAFLTLLMSVILRKARDWFQRSS